MKETFKNIERSKCAKCEFKSSQGIKNEKCAECKKKYCPDHFWRGMYKKGMKDTEELRIVCDDCKVKHGYH